MGWLADNLLLIIALSLLVALSVASSYQWLRLQRKLNNLETPPDKNALITAFLNEQSTKTQRLKNTKLLKLPGLNKKVLSLRHAYLKIESRMLESHKYNSRDYYVGLATHLAQLLKIIDGDPEHRAEIAHSLHQAAQSINLSESDRAQIIECIEALLEQADKAQIDSHELHIIGKRVLYILNHADEPEHKKQSAKAYAIGTHQAKVRQQSDDLKQLAHTNRIASTALREHAENDPNSTLLLEKIEAFEQENHRLSLQVSMLQHELNGDKRSPYKDGNQRDETLASLADQLIEFNEQEIRKLKNTVRSQKKIIFDLQETLEKHQNIEPQDLTFYTEQLAQLQLNLGQAETCIGMLEDELADLRNKLKDAKRLEEEARNEALKAQLSAITEDIKPAATELHQQKSELEFIQEAINADSLEDLSLLLYQYYLDQHYSPVLMITHKSRRIEMGPSGSLNIKQKSSIKALMPNESTFERTSAQLYFNYQFIGGILTLPAHNQNTSEQDKALKMARIADRFIEKIMANHANRQLKKQIENGSNLAKQLARDTENSYDQQINSIKTVVFENFKNIHNLLHSKNATPTQMASIKQAEQDIIEELMANNSYRIKLRREFINLVKKIEDK